MYVDEVYTLPHYVNFATTFLGRKRNVLAPPPPPQRFQEWWRSIEAFATPNQAPWRRPCVKVSILEVHYIAQQSNNYSFIRTESCSKLKTWTKTLFYMLYKHYFWAAIPDPIWTTNVPY